MPERIPQSVARRVVLKVFLTSDHVTAATGKTVAVVISKNGAAFANPSAGATNATEIGSGWYYVDLSTTDTGTTGPLIVRGTSASCDDAEERLFVADAHNAGFDGVPSATAGAAGGVPLSIPTAADNATAVWDLATTGHETVGTFGAAMSAAGSAGDPWSTSLPGAYAAGTAGYLVGTNLDAKVTSRSTFNSATDAVAHVTLCDTTTNLTNAGSVQLDVYSKAFLYGKVAVDTSGNWTYYDATDGVTKRLKFTRVASPGGRTVTLDPA